MPRLKEEIVPSIVHAICPECGMPSNYDFKLKKWVCIVKDCKEEFNWIVSGKKQVWWDPD